MTEKSIMIVDDDCAMRATVRKILEIDNYNVTEAATAEEMYAGIKTTEISLILLDLVLQNEDGLEIMGYLKQNFNIPVIMLTGKDDIIDKVVGLEVGADDYITKPFHVKELLARIKTVIRRDSTYSPPKAQKISPHRIYSFCNYTLDIYAHTLTNAEGVDLNITTNEYKILTALIEAAGTVLSRDQLLTKLDTRSVEYSPYDRSLDVMIAKIRKKMEDTPINPKFIRTIRQIGYMFIADVEYKH